MQCTHCGTWCADKQVFCFGCGEILVADDRQVHIGPYRLLAKIGQGGMGVVYRAHDPAGNKPVAIKVLDPHLLYKPKQRERFKREARMHKKLVHSNIVPLLDVVDEEGVMALVLELVHGCTLKEYQAYRGIPDWPEVVYIGQAILAALSEAHTQGVIHRDLKPSNVFLEDGGGIKLMDFGLAKSQQGGENITHSGVPIGTYLYMAPEQILGEALDIRSDLYSFGVMLFQLCTGQLPFISQGGGEFEIMEKQVRQPAPPPQEINSAIPDALAAVIVSLLAKEPKQRPEGCAAVADALASVADAAAPSLPKPGDTKGPKGFSELHVRVSGLAEKSFSEATTVVEEPPENCLLWAFRTVSSPAPDLLPVDLNRPPAIAPEQLQRLRQGIAAIPPLPQVWHEVLQLCDDPEAAPSDLAHVIGQDPVLTAHILRLGNSAAFAPSSHKEITQPALAIARMGMDTARDFILHLLVPDLARAKPTAQAEIHRIWRHSHTIALLFRLLNDHARLVDRHVAGLFGLLHDIGKIVMLLLENEARIVALAETLRTGTPALQAELQAFGYTHIDAGMMLALHWQLPRSVHRFIYYHHHPCWHDPGTWPADVQPAIMLGHMAHIALQAMAKDDAAKIGVWDGARRSHVPASEPMLRRPLRLPLVNIGEFTHMQHEVERLLSVLPA